MNLQTKINRVACFATELEMIEYSITVFETMAKAAIEFGFTKIDVIMETLPTNGARAMVKPLFPVQSPFIFPGMLGDIEDDKFKKPPQPVGYQRWYDPATLDEKEGSLLTMLEVDSGIALAMIDTGLNRLKRRKVEILNNSKNMLKP